MIFAELDNQETDFHEKVTILNNKGGYNCTAFYSQDSKNLPFLLTFITKEYINLLIQPVKIKAFLGNLNTQSWHGLF